MRLEPLAGGVSSDIYRVDTGELTLCVKRALPKLKVAAEWRAPVSRNGAEVAWLRRVAALAPGHVPAVLGDDPDGGAFAMTWLPPADYPTWKTLLRDGCIEAGTAAAVGALLGRIHAATADNPQDARTFANAETFRAIRLEPYLAATGRAHPDLAARFDALADATEANARVLVHGDYSPKNILIGRDGPVVVDAECATFGEPAFDLAFVQNHLLLKALWRPHWKARYAAAFDALAAAYAAHVKWESWPSLQCRAAALLPALLLARADGKSPAEYLSDADREHVRAFARPRVAAAPATLAAIRADWFGA